MKLRNEITGEIRKGEAREDGIYLYDETTEQWYKYELDLLAKGWEYYEEPKDFWYIKPDGSIAQDNFSVIECDLPKEWYERMLKIGNYFETEEEAEKAVEKLKAWKRLKELGFRFIGETCEYKSDKHFGSVFFETSGDMFDIVLDIYEDASEFYDDLDLLFGGEE